MPAYILALFLLALTSAQQIGTHIPEIHPKLIWHQCTKSGGCTPRLGYIVLDANWRALHSTTGTASCYDGETWNPSLCPDGVTCNENCALEGADYTGSYGITTNGDEIRLNRGTGVTSEYRVYLMDTADSSYERFNPNNQEFTFDVDVSTLPCSAVAELHFLQMPFDGGNHPSNKAGARYGMGYCSAHCPRDMKFVMNGEANVQRWETHNTKPNYGRGGRGSCCAKMDLWKANGLATAYASHPCAGPSTQPCDGSQCESGGFSGCDRFGCDFNSFTLRSPSFYGPSGVLNSTQKMTVITQFIPSNTSAGAVTEIRRIYIQNGKTIQNAVANVPGMRAFDSISTQYCTALRRVFPERSDENSGGGVLQLGRSMSRGLVLAMGIVDNSLPGPLYSNSPYPIPPTTQRLVLPGGTCTRSAVDSPVQTGADESGYVKYSNIRFGDIGSAYVENP